MRSGLIILLLLGSIANPLAQQPENWTQSVEAKKGNQRVAAYRARLVGNVLLVEATHEPGWHTYALDNVERATKRAGEPPLGIEKPTQIEVGGGLKTSGKWRQSPPKDLSQPEINWYTWGFEGVSLFAARVERTNGAEAVIRINAQACKATTCAIIDDLEIKLPLPPSASGQATFDLSQLVEQGDYSDLKD